MLFPPGRPPVRGLADIRAFWGGRSPDFQVLEHRLEPRTLDVHGTMAVDEGIWSNTTRWRDDPPTTSSGVYLVVWSRGEDGVWRMEFDMWHPPLPPRSSGSAEAETAVAIVNVNVLPMTTDTVLTDQSVVIRGGRIAAMGPTERVDIPTGAQVIDAAGRYMLPGLIDSHVHLRSESELESYLRHGITTVVNMRGTQWHLDTRDAISAGELTGPRIFTAGPLLDGDPPIWSGSATRVVTTAAEARAAVAEHVDAGYDFVKTYNNLDPDLLEVVVAAAHERGFAVAAHLPRRPVRSEGLRRAARAGIDLIAHGEEVFFTHFGGAPDSLIRAGLYAAPSDDEIMRAARMIRDAGVAVVPNLSFITMTARMIEDLEAVYDDPEFDRLDPDVQEMWREQNPTRRPNLVAFTARERAKRDVVRRLTLALHELGAPLLLGTDASAPGLYPGASAHVEIAELVSAGLTPYDAISTATRVPGIFISEHLRGAPPLGAIAPGQSADLLLVDGSPLADPGTLARPWRVLRDGRVVWSRGR